MALNCDSTNKDVLNTSEEVNKTEEEGLTIEIKDCRTIKDYINFLLHQGEWEMYTYEWLLNRRSFLYYNTLHRNYFFYQDNNELVLFNEDTFYLYICTFEKTEFIRHFFFQQPEKKRLKLKCFIKTMQGRRMKQEDRYIAVSDVTKYMDPTDYKTLYFYKRNPICFYAICDGHRGIKACEYCQNNLIKNIILFFYGKRDIERNTNEMEKDGKKKKTGKRCEENERDSTVTTITTTTNTATNIANNSSSSSSSTSTNTDTNTNTFKKRKINEYQIKDEHDQHIEPSEHNGHTRIMENGENVSIYEQIEKKNEEKEKEKNEEKEKEKDDNKKNEEQTEEMKRIEKIEQTENIEQKGQTENTIHKEHTEKKEKKEAENEMTKELDAMSDEEIAERIKMAFRKTDADFLRTSKFAFHGCTVISLIIFKNKMFVANLGDCRAIGVLKKNNLLTYEALSYDHKPNNPSEKERIKQNGGDVLCFQNVYRVVAQANKNNKKKLVNNELTMNEEVYLSVSRAIGDKDFKYREVLSATPDVICRDICRCIKDIEDTHGQNSGQMHEKEKGHKGEKKHKTEETEKTKKEPLSNYSHELEEDNKKEDKDKKKECTNKEVGESKGEKEEEENEKETEEGENTDEELFYSQEELKYNFVFMACDGVWDILSNQHVVQIIQNYENDPDKACSEIIKTAYQKGSQDNLTAMLFQFF